MAGKPAGEGDEILFLEKFVRRTPQRGPRDNLEDDKTGGKASFSEALKKSTLSTGLGGGEERA